MKNHKVNTIKDIIEQVYQNPNNLHEYLSALENKYTQIEPELLAFIPEKDRFTRLQKEIKSHSSQNLLSESRFPLFGLVIGVKDIFSADGFQTRAGSKLHPDHFIDTEAACVSALRKLGAFILGKTVTTEFAYFAPGPTRNPHNHSHTPGGSSSGSAAAVSAGIIPFAFGSQTIGSIIRPASFCGVVGFKPTYDRIPTQGVIPLSPSVDTVGYFTPDVASAQFMANFLCDGWDTSNKKKFKPVLGIPNGPYLTLASDEMLSNFKGIIQILREAGYQIKAPPVMADFEDIAQRHNLIVAYEAAQVHADWYTEFSALYHYKTSELIHRGLEVSAAEYHRALEERNEFRDELTKQMHTQGIDLWLSPPAKGAAPVGLGSTGDPIMNLPWTHCGFPTLNIPSGFNAQNLPLGLQVSAEWQRDEDLLSWGVDFEKILNRM